MSFELNVNLEKATNMFVRDRTLKKTWDWSHAGTKPETPPKEQIIP